MIGSDAGTLRDHAPSRSAGWLRGGVSGYARLTGSVAVALLVLLAAEGATIPCIGQLLGPHIFIGMMLVPPVLLKMGSTGYRFVRYYTRSEPYVRKGPPAAGLRLLAPGVVLTTLALFGTGVALAFSPPPSHTLVFAHKLSFFAWVALMTLHVLGHVLEVPRLATADLRRSGRAEAGGGAQRSTALALALAGGLALGLLGLSLASSWL
jgi:hypothetical protein